MTRPEPKYKKVDKWVYGEVKEIELIGYNSEFENEKYSSVEVVSKKIKNKIDLYDRGHTYEVVKINNSYPEYFLKNIQKYQKFIVATDI